MSETSNRPLSPHLQIYRPQITSVLSILLRITGVLLAGGLLVLVAWLYAAASGRDAFETVQTALFSVVGLLAMLGITGPSSNTRSTVYATSFGTRDGVSTCVMSPGRLGGADPGHGTYSRGMDMGPGELAGGIPPMRTVESKVGGLGSAKAGFHHWWLQRLTAIALVPLGLLFLFPFSRIVGNDWREVTLWFESPMERRGNRAVPGSPPRTISRSACVSSSRITCTMRHGEPRC